MHHWQLAQLNIAHLLAPLDSPQLAPFVAKLESVNALAEASEGFVWRLQTESGDATDVEHDFGDDVIANMSVWESVEALHAYVYRSAHIKVMRRRKEWFEQLREAYTVLWWVPAGHRPTLAEAKRKLDHLRVHGPTADAFTFKQAFSQPSAGDAAGLRAFDDECPAY